MKWKSGTQFAFWANAISLIMIAGWALVGSSINSNQIQWPPHPIIGLYAVVGLLFLLCGVIAQED